MKREIKIGLTGIAALVILFVGINFLKGVKLFDTSKSYYIVFKNAKGLTKSSTVYADGFNIGIVDNVTYARPGEVVVRINVGGDVKIPHGTIANLDEAMLGGCTLNLIMGANPADCFTPGDTIRGSEANGLMAAAANVIPQVQVVLAHVDSLIQTLNSIASDPNLPLILQNAEQITESLNKSSDQLNTLLKNDIPQLTTTFNRAGENIDTLTGNLAQLDIQSTLNKVDQTMDNLHRTTLKLNSPDNNIGLLLNDTALYGNLNTTVNSATYLLEDMKAHPGRYINISVFGKKNK